MSGNMESSSAPTVTIDRRHLDVLVRRANAEYVYHPPGESLVCISQAEYDALIQSRRQHETLKQNLMVSGMGSDDLATLCEEDITAEAQVSEDLNSIPSPSLPAVTPKRDVYNITPYRKETVRGARLDQSPFNPYPGPVQRNQLPQSRKHAVGGSSKGIIVLSNSSADLECTQFADPNPHRTQPSSVAARGERNKIPVKGQRSVLLTYLPGGTTWLDVTSAIRGGALAEIYLPATGHYAIVSFLREEDARTFMKHAEQNDVYIKREKVPIKWAHRQFWLSPHAARKAAIGATRNLIICNCGEEFTEDEIRADLEHIHRLVIIKVDFGGGNCYIKTNSIDCALFAMSCMQSRRKYKSSKIVWDVDECDRPVRASQEAQVRETAQPVGLKQASAKKLSVSMQNRFALLSLCDSNDSEMWGNKDTSI
ncbi:hypothetical protein F5Y06DRAFT_260391 [Hypoxylon sp. FL0890]|nr:hypothetical protein F5Y06DRAFT_260391 [Hypoxylon sp. FL0890]